jgi:hypothetical protein
MLLAAALRLYRLDALPPGLYHDEAYNGLDALALLRGEPRPLFHEVWEQVAFADKVDALPHGWLPVFFVGNYGREPLFYYLLALSLAAVGARPLAIRLVPALTGVLVVLAVYWLARELLARDEAARGRRVALLAALNIATWYWLVHFSRFGIRPMLLALVVALTFACLLRGFRIGSQLYWASGGFWLGLSLYTYTPARMLPLAILGWLAVVASAERGFFRRRWREGGEPGRDARRQRGARFGRALPGWREEPAPQPPWPPYARPGAGSVAPPGRDYHHNTSGTRPYATGLTFLASRITSHLVARHAPAHLFDQRRTSLWTGRRHHAGGGSTDGPGHGPGVGVGARSEADDLGRAIRASGRVAFHGRLHGARLLCELGAAS